MRGHSRTLPAIVFRFPAARDKFSREGHAGPTELLCSGDDDDTKFGPGWTDSRMARSQTDRGLTANGHPSGPGSLNRRKSREYAEFLSDCCCEREGDRDRDTLRELDSDARGTRARDSDRAEGGREDEIKDETRFGVEISEADSSFRCNCFRKQLSRLGERGRETAAQLIVVCSVSGLRSVEGGIDSSRKGTRRGGGQREWMAATLYASLMGGGAAKKDEGHEVEFWHDPERAGWLMKQGEYLRTWRRRWFVLKEGKIFWFKETELSKNSKPRGVILVGNCLTVKGAEDALNRPYAFELSTSKETMYFIADTDKEKEDWINSIGRSIVRHSKSVTDDEVLDYDSKPVGNPK
ncbi:hypothetical protein AXG93_2528s1470 [Marchantia polymorpha subsp. ruderalis]|uniref:PH domain-containing protein n=3 Tax=Marchantia polymorpha TaxID=3197 RepID=A0A176WQ84_MARPO|nr:hypothetical protein AXG93_2528s1470 [Marchantia polymorpha subsp. ruderalis]